MLKLFVFTRPVENVVISTKGLQDRNNLLLDERTVKYKGKVILTEYNVYGITLYDIVRDHSVCKVFCETKMIEWKDVRVTALLIGVLSAPL